MKKLIALRAVRHMAKSGMNPKTLQYLMGHSDIAVTLNVYTHVGLEDAEKELQKMQGLENARKEMGISDEFRLKQWKHGKAVEHIQQDRCSGF